MVNTVWSHLHVEPKNKQIKTKKRSSQRTGWWLSEAWGGCGRYGCRGSKEIRKEEEDAGRATVFLAAPSDSSMQFNIPLLLKFPTAKAIFLYFFQFHFKMHTNFIFKMFASFLKILSNLSSLSLLHNI